MHQYKKKVDDNAQGLTYVRWQKTEKKEKEVSSALKITWIHQYKDWKTTLTDQKKANYDVQLHQWGPEYQQNNRN